MADKSVTVTLKASVASYLSQMAAASKATSGFRGSLSTVGVGLTKFVTLPVLAAGAASIKAAMDWESAFAGVRKTVEATEPQFRKLEAGLRDMTSVLPATHDEIAGVAESAGQLGIKVRDIESFTRTMVDMGETTNLTAIEASEGMARLGNIMQMPQKEAQRLGSAIVDLGNKGAATEQEILAMGLRIAGAGHQIGLSEAEVVSFGETLASVGIRAEAGGSAISRAFIEISNHIAEGGKALNLLAETAGVAVPEFSQLFETDAAEAMTLFVEGLGRVKKEGGDVFAVLEDLGLSEIRLRDALLRLAGAGDLLRNSLITGNKAWEDNTALAEEARKRYATTESQMRMTVNQIKDIGISLGQQMLPHVRNALQGIQGLLEGFRKLSPAMQSSIVKWGLIAAAAGPALLIFNKLIGVVGALATPMGLLKGGLGFIAYGLYEAHQNAQKLEQGTTDLAGQLVSGAITVDDLADKLRELAEAEDDAALKAAILERGEAVLEGSTRKATETVRALERQVSLLPGALSATRRGFIEDAIASGDFAGALRLLTAYQDEFLRGAKKAQRGQGDLTAAFAAHEEAAKRLAAHIRRVGREQDEAAAATKRLDDKMFSLSETIMGMPDRVRTPVSAPGIEEGIRDFQRLHAAEASVDRSVTINVMANVASALAALAQIRNALPGFQHGGITPYTGAFRVGEAGPETVLLPRGAKVVPHGGSVGTMTQAPRSGGSYQSVVLNGDIILPDVEDGEGFVSELQGIARAGLNRRGLG